MSGGIQFDPMLVGAVEIVDGGITSDTFATDAINANALAADAVQEIGVEILAECINALNTAVPSSPTADSLLDILSKTTGNTYSRTTDSLEAISDAIAAITSGSYMQRSADSGSLLMTGSEQILYEAGAGSVFEIGGGWINWVASAGAAYTLKIYVKVKSGGSYINTLTATNYIGETAGIMPLSPFLTNSAVAVTGNIPRFNAHGIKVTLQQTTAGAGYTTVDHEWFDTLG